MTPGIKLAEKAKIPHRVHEYIHDPSSASYGLEAAEKLGVDPKVLVAQAALENGWGLSAGGPCSAWRHGSPRERIRVSGRTTPFRS